MTIEEIVLKYGLEYRNRNSISTFYVPVNLVDEIYPLTRTIEFIMRYRQVVIEALDKKGWIFKYVQK